MTVEIGKAIPEDYAAAINITQNQKKPLPEVLRRLPEDFLPDKLPAVGAVGGLPQVRGHKLVSVDLVDSPSHSPLALPGKMLEDSVSMVSGCTLKERTKREMCNKSNYT